jgi:methyl-accepting chemotaxis protein
MGSLSLKVKIGVGFGAILLILALVVGYAVAQIREIQHAVEQAQNSLSGRRDTLLVRLYNEISIAGVPEAAQSTSHGAGDSQKAAAQLAHMSTELRELVGQFKY